MARKGSSLNLITTRRLAKGSKSPIHEALDIFDSSSIVCFLGIGLEPFIGKLGVLSKKTAKLP